MSTPALVPHGVELSAPEALALAPGFFGHEKAFIRANGLGWFVAVQDPTGARRCYLRAWFSQEYDADAYLNERRDNGAIFTIRTDVCTHLDAGASVPAVNAELLAGLKWVVGQLQGDSGTGESYWEQFPEYRAACAAITKAEAAK